MSLASMHTRLRERAISFRIAELDLIGVTSALTLFLVATFGFEHWIPKIATNILIVAVLVYPALMRQAMIWLVLAAMSTIALAVDWYVADNHKYLLVYWLWVIWIAHSQPDRREAEEVLQWHARFFIIFIFLMAAGQKVFSPSYMSGEMFELKLLFDDRFEAFAHLIGIDGSLIESAARQSALLRSPLSEIEGDTIILESNEWVRQVAMLITWYDLYVQVAIGLLFIPRRFGTDLAGHALLLFFILTTYLPAPVFGFGWTICILGFVTAFNRINSLIYWYAAAFMAIILYQAPWREWVLS